MPFILLNQFEVKFGRRLNVAPIIINVVGRDCAMGSRRKLSVLDAEGFAS